ncbi:hypothetical protein ACFVU4_03950 [Streptomyces sp. NPDC058107]|uniref:hypothetical protein n=1 Tax=Streptomyces sp. NPDC058107 TaxID=3346343 RepID=UPI0036E5080C
MKTKLDNFATAFYVKTDHLLKASPRLAPWWPAVGIAPQLADAELVTLAMMQAMLGFASEARWLRHARSHLRHLFSYLPKQPGYNKRLCKSADLLCRGTRLLTTDSLLRVARRRVDRGLHTGGMRPLQRDRQTFRPGRMGRVRDDPPYPRS